MLLFFLWALTGMPANAAPADEVTRPASNMASAASPERQQRQVSMDINAIRASATHLCCVCPVGFIRHPLSRRLEVDSCGELKRARSLRTEKVALTAIGLSKTGTVHVASRRCVGQVGDIE
jgi:hypothetical protein